MNSHNSPHTPQFIKNKFLIFLCCIFLLQIHCNPPCKGSFGFIGEALKECKKDDNLLLLGILLATNRNRRPSSCPSANSIRKNLPSVGSNTIELSGADCNGTKLQEAVNQGGKIILRCNEIQIPNQIVVGVDQKVHLVGAKPSGVGKTILRSTNKRILFTRGGSITIVENLEFRDGVSEATTVIVGGQPAVEKNAGGALFNGFKAQMFVLDSHFYDNQGGIEADGPEEGGGAIYTKSFGRVTIVNSYFKNNTGGLGGAINNLLSRLIVVDSTFEDNSALVGNKTGYGGAIYTDGGGLGGSQGARNKPELNPPPGLGPIQICGCVFKNNKGKGQGGGAFLYGYPGDTITVEKSIFIGNTLEKDFRNDALGGGLRTGNAQTRIVDTLFIENISRRQGGGYWKGEREDAELINTLFWENFTYDGPTNLITARNRNIGQGLGGAITGERIHIQNSTIVNNHAGGVAGAVWGGNNSVKNSIIAFNTAFNEGNNFRQGNNCFGPNRLNDRGGNFEFPDKFAGNTGQNNITCVSRRIEDPKYVSEETFEFPNSPVTTIPRAKLEFCNLEVGAEGYKERFRFIPLQNNSPAVGKGFRCP